MKRGAELLDVFYDKTYITAKQLEKDQKRARLLSYEQEAHDFIKTIPYRFRDAFFNGKIYIIDDIDDDEKFELFEKHMKIEYPNVVMTRDIDKNNASVRFTYTPKTK